ncbi:MAG: Rpp14/Pop5 family protein [Candidatus Verstraetearchaeota archaeon]|jgi:RNase P/RNase MRP subunit POP5|nr:Rpp14/Pop5 family protein [Candidatus Verstraetearchaeota archaeon]
MVKEVRWRYVIFHVHSPLSLASEDLRAALRRHMKAFLGTYGLSRNPFKLMDYDEENKLGILKCAHESLEVIRAALALLSAINGEPSAIHVMKVSGTYKKAKSRAARLAEKLKSYWTELEAGMKKPSQATEA